MEEKDKVNVKEWHEVRNKKEDEEECDNCVGKVANGKEQMEEAECRIAEARFSRHLTRSLLPILTA